MARSGGAVEPSSDRAESDNVARADDLRERIVDANDGIIATAGIIEGFVGAGAADPVIVLAAVAAMIAGGFALGAVKYSETATQRDARQSIIDEERRLLERTPEEEQAELAAIYVDKGLSPELATRVAAELSATNPLGSQLDAEYGILADLPRPLPTALTAFGCFVLGAAVPLAAALFAPDTWRALITLAAVVLALFVTSVIAARVGRARLWRTVLRTVLVGVFAVAISLGVGRLL